MITPKQALDNLINAYLFDVEFYASAQDEEGEELLAEERNKISEELRKLPKKDIDQLREKYQAQNQEMLDELEWRRVHGKSKGIHRELIQKAIQEVLYEINALQNECAYRVSRPAKKRKRISQKIVHKPQKQAEKTKEMQRIIHSSPSKVSSPKIPKKNSGEIPPPPMETVEEMDFVEVKLERPNYSPVAKSPTQRNNHSKASKDLDSKNITASKTKPRAKLNKPKDSVKVTRMQTQVKPSPPPKTSSEKKVTTVKKSTAKSTSDSRRIAKTPLTVIAKEKTRSRDRASIDEIMKVQKVPDQKLLKTKVGDKELPAIADEVIATVRTPLTKSKDTAPPAEKKLKKTRMLAQTRSSKTTNSKLAKVPRSKPKSKNVASKVLESANTQDGDGRLVEKDIKKLVSRYLHKRSAKNWQTQDRLEANMKCSRTQKERKQELELNKFKERRKRAKLRRKSRRRPRQK